MMCALLRVKTIKLLFWYHESAVNAVIARVSSSSALRTRGDGQRFVPSIRDINMFNDFREKNDCFCSVPRSGFCSVSVIAGCPQGKSWL